MPQRSRPVTLEEAVRMIEGRVLVGLDFDGTLAPIVDHPDLAVPAPGVMDVLVRLSAKPGVEVVVVSGRSRSDLQSRLGDVPGVVLMGEHGNDRGGPSPDTEAMVRAVAFVRGLAADLEGAVVEEKPRSVAFHYRMADTAEAERTVTLIEEFALGQNGIRILEGKEVIELSTATGTKGDYIRAVADGATILYVGDDITDETVFELLGPDDIGVKVGDGPSQARYRVADTAAVVSLLEMADLALG